eukprot:TRINITY_DN25211_c0_g1_i1.p1 TRINITY_DN25211_c0_g1~~TRINITY_DN25211_c0_g1_i1.p1  ORF type:complete len:462 (+),score=269.78 TRINITY_DN25211_c0_g1_i1:124-1509(+)
MGEASWVGEWLTQFLKSPLWTAPINSFVDEHCDIFEEDDEEENKLEYTIKHKMFTEVVDELLTQNLGDMGVSQDQFLEIVGNDENESLDAMVREYVMSMDDFRTFRKMMEKRNIELELEAMSLGSALVADEMMLQKVLDASEMEEEKKKKALQAEDLELQHALAMSLAAEQERHRLKEEELAAKHSNEQDRERLTNALAKEHEERVNKLKEETMQARLEVVQRDTEVQQLEKEAEVVTAVVEEAKAEEKKEEVKAAADPPAPKPEEPKADPPAAKAEEPAAPAPPKEVPIAHKKEEVPLEKKAGGLAPIGGGGPAKADPFAKAPLKPLPGLAPGSMPSYHSLKNAVVENKEKEIAVAVSRAPASAAVPQAPPPPENPNKPSDSDIERRTAYLKQQRDMLIQRKKEERAKELNSYIKEKTGAEPPPPPATDAPAKGVPVGLDETQLEMRRALARKVKEDLLK